jgi:hypothetical protein
VARKSTDREAGKLDQDGAARKGNERTGKAAPTPLECLQADLKTVQLELAAALHKAGGDAETVKDSVQYCGLMVRWHGIRSLLLAVQGGSDDRDVRQESLASREWSKAMATAIEKSSYDTLQRIAKRLEDEDRLKGEMAEI